MLLNFESYLILNVRASKVNKLTSFLEIDIYLGQILLMQGSHGKMFTMKINRNISVLFFTVHIIFNVEFNDL